MNYPFILQFSSITHLTDARYASGMWADFVGFCFNPSSENYIEPNKAKEIIAWINGPLIVGEFNHQPKEWIDDFIKELKLKAIQLPSTYDDLSVLELNVKIILDIENSKLKMPLLSNADLILVHNEMDYQWIKPQTKCPIIIKAFEGMDCKAYDGIAFTGEKELEIGFRDHAWWNSLLEPYTN
jgi:phosphoribosylanthranilate isomerase